MVSMNKESKNGSVRHYFEYSESGVEVISDGLVEVPFGEYLVETGKLSRDQLFAAMMFQDQNPGVRIGECVAALGYVPYTVVDQAFTQYNSL